MFESDSPGGTPIGEATAVTRSLFVPDLLGTGQSLFWDSIIILLDIVLATQESLFFLVAIACILYYVH